jgi:hypothetical protein
MDQYDVLFLLLVSMVGWHGALMVWNKSCINYHGEERFLALSTGVIGPNEREAPL